jgi:phthalate 4,5-dioxygenase oxygenase subunit
MGPIYDRTREHLGTTDVAIIFWRRLMLRLARNLDNGIEPAILTNPDAFRVLPLQTTVPEADFGNVWQAHHDTYRAALQGAR